VNETKTMFVYLEENVGFLSRKLVKSIRANGLAG